MNRNRRWFDSAAAAESAGFRACFQCRPYRTQPGWSPTAPELVCRALHLVLDGALDGRGTETQLAADVGASPRHLRRLFLEHLGVTPTQLARSARAHFARRLIDDTDMTFAAIAHCASFGSIRQFNTTMRQTFRASPTELRAKRRRTDRLVADGGLVVRLPHARPIDFEQLLSRLVPGTIPLVSDVRDSVYRRTIETGEDIGLLEVRHGGNDHLLATLHMPHWREAIHHVQAARRLLGLDDAERSAVGHWDPFESAVAVLVRSDDEHPEHTLRTLVTTFGQPVAGLHQHGLTHAFPRPATLAGADLEAAGIPPRIAGPLEQLARGVADGSLRLDRGVSAAQLHASLACLGPFAERIESTLTRGSVA